MIKTLTNTYELCDKDINKSILFLRKVFYPYECMWIYGQLGKFDKTLLANKEAFCSSLNMEDITDADYRHAKRVLKNVLIVKSA